MRIIAVVVTYNRLDLLRRNISCLRANKPVSHIVVINNGSSDGTLEWLSAEVDERLTAITQENVGGSGGFARGIDEACRMGAEWVWCMDDDVFPREDCLERMLPFTEDEQTGLIAPRRLMDGKVFTNDFKDYDWRNPFASLYKGKLKKMHIDSPTEIAGTAFEGPLIRRKAIERVGLPKKELFIFCDDTDYCIRIRRAGYKLIYIPDALMDKHRFFTDDSWKQRTRKKMWKRMYQVRNSTYLNHHYGQTWAVRHLRGWLCVMGYIMTAILTMPFVNAYQWEDIPKLWQAYKDGINEELRDKG